MLTEQNLVADKMNNSFYKIKPNYEEWSWVIREY